MWSLHAHGLTVCRRGLEHQEVVPVELVNAEQHRRCSLQAQLEALVTDFGLQHSSTDLALPLWTAVLAQSGVLNEEQHE